jgi:phosphoribosylformylglycinamidine synthase PurS subunit
MSGETSINFGINFGINFRLRTLNFRERHLKAKVYVTLKQGVLDPQGKAIQHSVELLGYGGIADVRQGKYFEIALDSSLDEAGARETAERMARDVLSNPVIEDYRVEVEG